MISKLHERYRKEILPALMKELELKNPMSVPRLKKIVVNMGIGIVDKNIFDKRVNDLATITGQRPIVTKAKKSISNFKLREGMTIGAKVTLRGERMYEFVERLVGAALPRIRDFRGVSPDAFDGRGNFSMGVQEIEIFPEIQGSASGGAQGMDVTMVTSATDDRGARALLKALGIPFAVK